MVKKRNNTCFDLGAHAEVLSGVMGGEGWFGVDGPIPAPDDLLDSPEKELPGPPSPNSRVSSEDSTKALKDRYKKYILMNASIRGPFVPLWSKECWSDAYLNKVTENIKLVGMSYNCHLRSGHVQSMIWATDSIGLARILTPAAIGDCFPTLLAATDAEVRTTSVIRAAGHEVDVFLSVYHSKDKETKTNTPEIGSSQEAANEDGSKDDGTNRNKNAGKMDIPGDFWKNCTDEDWLGAGKYFGTFVHPYENLFMKSHRHIEDTVLDRLTEWHDGMGYESYDVC